MMPRLRVFWIAVTSALFGAAGALMLLAPQAQAHAGALAPSLQEGSALSTSAWAEKADPGVARLVEVHRVVARRVAAFAKHRAGDDHLAIAASTIGVSKATLVEALKDGKSIADVARAHGVSPDTVVDALVAHEKAELAEKVAAGKISQARADAIEPYLDNWFTAFVNKDFGDCYRSRTDGFQRTSYDGSRWYRYHHR
jgi:hypothetical protein